VSDPAFALGTFASSNGRFAGLVMQNNVVDLSEGHKLFAASSFTLIELRAASLTVSEGSTDHSNQRIVGRLDPNKAMMAAALADASS
jgi:hypothetical protein